MTFLVAITGSIFAVGIAVALYCQTAIRMDVNERLPQDQRFYWSRQTPTTIRQLYRKYREFFPASRLPVISVCALCLALISLVLLNVLPSR